MEHKILEKLFTSHNEARDYLSENPELLIEGSELVQAEFKVVKGAVDILLKKDNIFYFVEIKDGGSLYSARQQLSRYGRMFERFSPLFQDKKLKYIVVKIQKYLGTDVYTYDDVDDVMSRTNNYDDIHYDRVIKTQKLPEYKKKYKDAMADPEVKRRYQEAMSNPATKKRWEEAVQNPEYKKKWLENMEKGVQKYLESK